MKTCIACGEIFTGERLKDEQTIDAGRKAMLMDMVQSNRVASSDEEMKFRAWLNASKLPQWIDQYETLETLCAQANKIMTTFLNTPESKEWQAKWQEFTSKL